MTYYGPKELASSFRTVRKNTIAIAHDIPEDKYSFRAGPETRTVGQTLAHIGLGPRFQQHIQQNRITDLATVKFPELFQQIMAEEAKSRTKAEIVSFLTEEGEAWARYVESLPESFLAEQVRMPPGAQPSTKSRFEMLLSVKEHEMHHRAQLMVLERMIGIVPHLTREYQTRFAQAAQPSAGA